MIAIQLDDDHEILNDIDCKLRNTLKDYLQEKHVTNKEFIDMKNENNILYEAIKEKRNDIAKYIIKSIKNIHEETRRGSTLLFTAIEYDNYSIADVLIREKDADINYINKKKENILFYLINRNSLKQKSLSYLLGHNLNLNYQDRMGKTCFIYLMDKEKYSFIKHIVQSTFYDNSFIIKCLISWKNRKPLSQDFVTNELNKIDFHLSDRYGSVYFYAIKQHNYSLFTFIKGHDSHFDPNEHNNSNLYLMHQAVRYNEEEIVKLLYQCHADINVNDNMGRSPFLYACQCHLTAMVKFLLSTNQIPLHSYIQHPDILSYLNYLCCCGDIDMLDDLIQKGFSLDFKDSNGCTPIMIAVENYQLELIKYLLKRNINVNERDNNGHTAIIRALSDRRLQSKVINDEFMGNVKQILELLLNHGANVNDRNKSGVTLLMMACQYGHKDLVDLLIHHGAIVHDTTSIGYSPLIYACQNGHLDIVSLLISLGADIHQKDEQQYTPLIHAVDGRSIETVKYLVQKGADVNVKDCMGQTPLMHVGQIRFIEAMECLLDHNANVDIQDNRGETCLIQSISFGNYEPIVRLLLQYQADITLRDHNNKTALDYAKERDLPELEKLLSDNI